MNFDGGEYTIRMSSVQVGLRDERQEKASWAKFRLGLTNWFTEDHELKLVDGRWEGRAQVSASARYLVIYGSNFMHRVDWTEDLSKEAKFAFLFG